MTAHLDRDKARDVLASTYHASVPNPILDALEVCVVPDPPQTIDRDKLRDAVTRIARGEYDTADDAVDAILALVQPAAGITLTPEEAQFVRHCVLHDLTEAIYDTEDIAVAESIAERIKESSA